MSLHRFFIYLCILFVLAGKAQDSSYTFREKVNSLVRDLKSGDSKALAKLLTYTQDTSSVTDFLGYHRLPASISTIAWRTIFEYIVIDEEELDRRMSNKPEFYKTLGKALPGLKFDPDLQVFVWPSAEKTNYSYKTENSSQYDAADQQQQLDEMKAQFSNRLKEEDAQDEFDVLFRIGKLRTPAAEQFLKGCLERTDYSPDNKKTLYRDVCKALCYFPTLNNAKLVIGQCKKGNITQKAAINDLATISGIALNERILDTLNPLPVAEKYFDFFKNTEDMHLYAYSLVYDLKKENCKSAATYYAQVVYLSEADYNNTLHRNALLDLSQTKDPECLRYLAAMIYRHRIKWDDYYFQDDEEESPAELIEKLTGIHLLLQNKKGDFSGDFDTKHAQFAYYSFWNEQYKNFTWNEQLQQFTSTKVVKEKPGDAYRIYHSLVSKSGRTAKKAFLQLIELPPSELSALLNSEPGVIDKAEDNEDYEEVLPMFLNKRMMGLSILIQFCKANNIPYKPSEKLQQQLDSLKSEGNDARRYKLENRIIAVAGLQDITPIEYWISSNGEDATYSVGRIVDKLYTRYFNEITSDELQLRLFLKKAVAYDNFGIIGNCNKLLWKFHKAPESLDKKLKQLEKTEKDPEIKTSISHYFTKDHWYSRCTGEVPILYTDMIPIEKTLSEIQQMDAGKRGSAYSNLQYNLFFCDQVVAGKVDKEKLQTMVTELERYAGDHADDDFITTYSRSFAAWVKTAGMPFAQQLSSVKGISEKEVAKKTFDLIALEGKYNDLPTLLDVYEQEWDNIGTWAVSSHITNDLGIPFSQRDTLRNRFKRLTEKDLYKAYATDFGLGDIFLPGDQLDYDRIYDVLEYDVADGFVGGGGGHHSTTVPMIIRILELHHHTLSGFHWRLEYIRPSTIHSLETRSCAWMKFIRDQQLKKEPVNPVPSFSN